MTSEPRTEAGRGLLAMDTFDTASLDDDAVQAIVTAIEDEARSLALSEVEAAVTGLRRGATTSDGADYAIGFDEARDSALRAITALREGTGQ